MSADLIRTTSCQKLEQDHPERVYIAAGIDFQWIGQHLLGTHVGQGSHELPKVGLARSRHVRVGDAGNPEIENFGLPVLVHKNVARFKIAVNDPAQVSVVYGFAHLGHEFQSLMQVEVVRVRMLCQWRTTDQLHSEIGLWSEASVRRPGFIDLSNARVP